MRAIDRRTFIRGAAVGAGGLVLGGRAWAAPPAGALGPVPDLRDGAVRLHLPPGFSYRSFHDTEQTVTLGDGTVLPGFHDGMATFPAPDGNVWLLRNHEVNGPGPAVGPGAPYDPMARAVTTTVLTTPRGEPLDSFTALNGTQMNCAGAVTPWGTYIACEETVNGPDVGPDFTGVSNAPLRRPHGFIFEIPAGGQSDRVPITAAGRFAHEAAVWDARAGVLYLTEDNFEFASGLFRFLPAVDPLAAGKLGDAGRLQMLRVVGQPNANLAVTQANGATYAVDWLDIDDPAPEFPYTPGAPPPTSNDDAISYVGNQGRAQGAALFSRLEGAVWARGRVHFAATQGGGPPEEGPGPIANGYGNGNGQIWALDPRAGTLTCVFQSPGPGVLDLPDNLAVRDNRGTIVICEDGPNDNYVRALARDGRLRDLALNRLVSSTGNTRFNDEFAGAAFSPDGGTLFVNIHSAAALTFAIWGPWGRLGV
jgi:secreted PhoX family phosphatase